MVRYYIRIPYYSDTIRENGNHHPVNRTVLPVTYLTNGRIATAVRAHQMMIPANGRPAVPVVAWKLPVLLT